MKGERRRKQLVGQEALSSVFQGTVLSAYHIIPKLNLVFIPPYTALVDKRSLGSQKTGNPNEVVAETHC